jgi:hypothetical protein
MIVGAVEPVIGIETPGLPQLVAGRGRTTAQRQSQSKVVFYET